MNILIILSFNLFILTQSAFSQEINCEIEDARLLIDESLNSQMIETASGNPVLNSELVYNLSVLSTLLIDQKYELDLMEAGFKRWLSSARKNSREISTVYGKQCSTITRTNYRACARLDERREDRRNSLSLYIENNKKLRDDSSNQIHACVEEYRIIKEAIVSQTGEEFFEVNFLNFTEEMEIVDSLNQ